MNISVLIPAFNEAATIDKTIIAIKKTGMVTQVLVVDDGSTDMTAKIATQAGAQVFSLPENQGKGAALNFGAKLVEGDIICLLDGDLGESAAEVEKLINPIVSGRAEMTIGVFPRRKVKSGFGLVKGLARLGIKVYTGKSMTEPLSGQRAFTREVFQQLLPFTDGYGVEVFLTIKAIKKGFTVSEVATDMSHNYTGRSVSGFLHRGRQFYHVAHALLKVRRKLI